MCNFPWEYKLIFTLHISRLDTWNVTHSVVQESHINQNQTNTVRLQMRTCKSKSTSDNWKRQIPRIEPFSLHQGHIPIRYIIHKTSAVLDNYILFQEITGWNILRVLLFFILSHCNREWFIMNICNYVFVESIETNQWLRKQLPHA